MRLWIGAHSSLGSVVMMVHERMTSPLVLSVYRPLIGGVTSVWFLAATPLTADALWIATVSARNPAKISQTQVIGSSDPSPACRFDLIARVHLTIKLVPHTGLACRLLKLPGSPCITRLQHVGGNLNLSAAFPHFEAFTVQLIPEQRIGDGGCGCIPLGGDDFDGNNVV
jgi:hypothetical protein